MTIGISILLFITFPFWFNLARVEQPGMTGKPATRFIVYAQDSREVQMPVNIVFAKFDCDLRIQNYIEDHGISVSHDAATPPGIETERF